MDSASTSGRVSLALSELAYSQRVASALSRCKVNKKTIIQQRNSSTATWHRCRCWRRQNVHQPTPLWFAPTAVAALGTEPARWDATAAFAVSLAGAAALPSPLLPGTTGAINNHGHTNGYSSIGAGGGAPTDVPAAAAALASLPSRRPSAPSTLRPALPNAAAVAASAPSPPGDIADASHHPTLHEHLSPHLPQPPPPSSQPPLPQLPPPPPRFNAVAQAALSRQVQDCADWPAVEALYRSMRAVGLSTGASPAVGPGGQQLVAMARHMARLPRHHSFAKFADDRLQRFAGELAASTVPYIGEMRQGELCALLWAYGKLDCHPGEQFMGALLARLQPLLLVCGPTGLSQALWGLARIGHLPPEPFLRDFYAAAGQALRKPSANPQHVSNLLWACVMLRLSPPEMLLARSLQLLADKVQDAAPQALALTAWAAVQLGSQPPSAAWWGAVEAAALQLTGKLQPQDVSHLVWSMARAGHRPANHWLHLMCCEAHSCLRGFRPQELSNLLWGIVVSGYRPSTSWLGSTITAAQKLLPGFKAFELAVLLWCLASLEAGPLLPQGFSSALFFHSGPKLGFFSAQDCSNVLWALAKLKLRPPEAWMAAFVEESFTQLPRFTPQHLANTMWAFAKLGRCPPEPWLDRYFLESRPLLLSFKACELAMTMMGFGIAHVEPPRQWLNQMLVASYSKLEYCRPQELANIVWALARIGFHPGQRWLDTAAAAASRLAAVGAMSYMDLVTIERAFGGFGAQMPAEVQQALERAREAELQLPQDLDLDPEGHLERQGQEQGQGQQREPVAQGGVFRGEGQLGSAGKDLVVAESLSSPAVGAAGMARQSKAQGAGRGGRLEKGPPGGGGGDEVFEGAKGLMRGRSARQRRFASTSAEPMALEALEAPEVDPQAALAALVAGEEPPVPPSVVSGFVGVAPKEQRWREGQPRPVDAEPEAAVTAATVTATAVASAAVTATAAGEVHIDGVEAFGLTSGIRRRDKRKEDRRQRRRKGDGDGASAAASASAGPSKVTSAIVRRPPLTTAVSDTSSPLLASPVVVDCAAVGSTHDEPASSTTAAAATPAAAGAAENVLPSMLATASAAAPAAAPRPPGPPVGLLSSPQSSAPPATAPVAGPQAAAAVAAAAATATTAATATGAARVTARRQARQRAVRRGQELGFGLEPEADQEGLVTD